MPRTPSDAELREAIEAALAAAAKVPCPAYLKDEAESAAVAAVGEAATRWDPARGPFVPYARTRAWGATIDFIRSWSPLTRGEWAAAVAVDVDAARKSVFEQSIDVPIGDDIELGDMLEADCPDPYAVAEAKDAAIRILAGLGDREALVVVLTIMLEWTQDEVATVIGTSPSRVSQLGIAGRKRAAPPAPKPLQGSAAVLALPNPPAVRGGDVPITLREAEVLQLIADGFTNREIGERLFLGEETVKTHVVHLLAKLQARSRAHVAAIGLRSGAIA